MAAMQQLNEMFTVARQVNYVLRIGSWSTGPAAE
jgi:hypothetical protein